MLIQTPSRSKKPLDSFIIIALSALSSHIAADPSVLPIILPQTISNPAQASSTTLAALSTMLMADAWAGDAIAGGIDTLSD